MAWVRRIGAATGWVVAAGVLFGLAGAGVLADAAAFVGSLFAAGASAGVVLLVEALSRASIDFEIEPSPPVMPGGRKFLRVHVWNSRLPRPMSLFFDRRPALLTRAWVTFLTQTNDPVFEKGRRMRGRWSSTPEPVLPLTVTAPSTGDPRVVLTWDLTRTTDSVDIPPGSFELLDVVMRVPHDDSCRGWHNGIIQRPNPPPEEQFELPKGRYHALIRVQTGGRSFRYVLRIVNDLSIEHFRLEPIEPQPALPEDL